MSATDSVPTPADLLAEAGRELGADSSGSDDGPTVPVAPQVAIPDPDHVIGDRICPVCDGAGRVPFEIPLSPKYEACPDCKGTGNVLTGSFDPDSAMILCERCHARGYVDRQTGEVPRELTNPHGEPPFEGMEWSEVHGVWRYP